jgi:serine/threonine-protein kinase
VVAVKVLSAALAADPQFQERFDREAKSISALNDPHICALYDIGHEMGVDFLVLEHLEGESLAKRLERGPLPLDQALKLAVEIAAALDKAHSLGITHRDLKPGNVMLTKAGAKLLDFGLAKVATPAADHDATAAPTRTAPLTQHGTLLGTFQYMAPEQIEGEEADKRSDIWAFGCVLHEMLTGTRAFDGKTHASLAGAILKDAPPRVSAVQPLAPSGLDHLVGTCLAKNPDDRWQSAADIARELKWIATRPSEVGAPAPALPERSIERWIWMGVTAVLVALSAIVLLRGGGTAPGDAAGPTVRAMVPFASAEALLVAAYPSVALSPDGHYIAYRGGSPAQIYVRATDESQSHAVAGTEGGLYPFFSPEGTSLGFLVGRTIKRMALGGGAPVTIVDLTTANLRGVAWGDDGWIYYTPTVSAGLWRIRASGGAAEQLTTPDFAAGEKTHRFPCVLPGSKALVFMVGTSRLTSFEDARIEVLALDTKTRHRLVDGGSYPQYASTGHLLYTRKAQLIAVPFDVNQLKLTGSPVTVADDMFADPYYGMGNYGVSRNGVAVRMIGGASAVPQTLASVDRAGASQPLKIDPVVIGAMGRVSPEGARLVTYFTGATSQLALFDLARGTSSRLTYEWDNETPVWSPDGARLAFISNRDGGPRNVYVMRADGGGSAERLTKSDHEQQAFSWSADGKTIAYTDTDPASGEDIWTVSVQDRNAAPLVKSPADDGFPAFSPDGRWIAYQSRQSSRMEIYVQAFPSGERRWQVSTDGGTTPFWQRDGHELVYRRGQSVMAVSVTTTPEFHHGEPVKLFDTPNVLVDVLPAGRLLMRTTTPAPPVTQLEVIVNWFSELRRRSGGG